LDKYYTLFEVNQPFEIRKGTETQFIAELDVSRLLAIPSDPEAQDDIIDLINEPITHTVGEVSPGRSDEFIAAKMANNLKRAHFFRIAYEELPTP
jgi:hypothetical protein